jgi:HSP20 family protein
MPVRHHFFRPDLGEARADEDYFALRCSCGRPGEGPYHPEADVFETAEGLVARFAVPGCRPEELELRLVGSTLRLLGNRRDGCPRRKKRFHQMEIHYGSFERSLPLPAPVDARGAEARYQDGMLEVFLPRARRASKRTLLIEIRL